MNPEFESAELRTAYIDQLALDVRGHSRNAHDIGRSNPDQAAEEARRASELFGPLIGLTSARIGSVALRFTRNEHDSADLSQQIYIKTFRFIHKFEARSSFESWLYRIAINESNTYAKVHSRIVRKELLSELKEDMHPLHTVELPDYETQTAVQEALSMLSDKLREAVEGYYIHDTPLTEIAAKLGISESAAKLRVHRARDILRGLLHSYAHRHDIIDEPFSDEVGEL